MLRDRGDEPDRQGEGSDGEKDEHQGEARVARGGDGASASVGGGVSSSGTGATKTGEVSDAGSVSSESIVTVLTSGWAISAAPASIVTL